VVDELLAADDGEFSGGDFLFGESLCDFIDEFGFYDHRLPLFGTGKRFFPGCENIFFRALAEENEETSFRSTAPNRGTKEPKINDDMP
jgi:hypothetical protein